ncbi:hypothetical protein Pyn_15463 [Prunus yedoensis var. nudiflora]|uniref:Uncharacterized protein n=1 Tax=Prunus yedoensis var. nudiflora TaxID=2094558 RepID=A0A314XNV1_PRUYE|nr:hypothetical protein Pyn_15463 [Prunus yedoensis var. nudiflora]
MPCGPDLPMAIFDCNRWSPPIQWVPDAGSSDTDDAELSDCTLMALSYHELADQRKDRKTSGKP